MAMMKPAVNCRGIHIVQEFRASSLAISDYRGIYIVEKDLQLLAAIRKERVMRDVAIYSSV